MRKKLWLCVIGMIALLAACGKKDENGEFEVTQIEALPISSEQMSDAQSEIDEARTRIDEQSFTVKLQQFGEVEFISYEPEWEKDPCEDVSFVIENENESITLPYVEEDNIRFNRAFHEVEAVAFRDYNADGYDDIIIICSYFLGAGPTAGQITEEIRFYKGLENHGFQYEEQMSEDATGALAEITIESALEFIGYGKGAVQNGSAADGSAVDFSGSYKPELL